MSSETAPKTELLNGAKIPSQTVPNFPGNGPKNGTQNRNRIINRNRHTPLPPEGGEGACERDSRSGKSQDQNYIQFAEAKRLLGRIAARNFEEYLRENQWSTRRVRWLREFLPLKRSDLELVDWYYGLETDDPARIEGGKLRRSFDTLLQNFANEVQKIRNIRKELGDHDQPGRPREPKAWQKIFCEIFPDRPPPTQSFRSLHDDEQWAINAEIAERETGPALWREFFAVKHQFPYLPETFAELASDLRNEWKLEHEAFEQASDWWKPTATALWGERGDLGPSILDLSNTDRAEVLKTFWRSGKPLWSGLT